MEIQQRILEQMDPDQWYTKTELSNMADLRKQDTGKALKMLCRGMLVEKVGFKYKSKQLKLYG